MEGPLRPAGPWLVFFSGEGIFVEEMWAVNADGSGLRQILSDLIVVPRDLGDATSSAGGRMAYITAADRQLRGLRLNLLSLPDGSVRQITPLTSASTEKGPDADPAARAPEPAVAITDETSLAWSPDGTKLAFMGAFEGPSSDLYVYDLLREEITRLTDGPSQGIQPHWSPDGQLIVHFGADTLGSGAGYGMVGAWSAAADGSGVTSLYDPSDGDGEEFVGWISDRTFLVYTMSQGRGGYVDLRAVQADTGEVRMLWEGRLLDAALDPSTGATILSADADSGRPPGIFSVNPLTRISIRIIDELASSVEWSPDLELFIARTQVGELGISPQGEIIRLPIPGPGAGRPVVAAGTDQMAWAGSALWLGSLRSSPQDPPRQVFNGPVQWVEFAPGGEGLIFLSEGNLYAGSPPDFNPRLLREGLLQHKHTWVFP